MRADVMGISGGRRRTTPARSGRRQARRLQDFGLLAILCAVSVGAVHRAEADPLYVGVTDQSFYGVATFTQSLGLIEQVQLPLSGPITGLAAGVSGEYYVSAGRTLYQFDAGNTLLHSINGSATTLLPALDFADGTVHVAVTDQSFFGVATFTQSLGLIGQVQLPVSGPITGLAAGIGGEYYVSAGRTLYQFDSTNALVRSIDGSATTLLPALDFVDGTLYVAVTDQNFFGVATFTQSLGLIGQFQLPVSGPITGLAAGVDGEYYVSAGRTLYQFDSGNTLLQSINGSATTQLPALSFAATVEPPTGVPEPGSLALFGLGLAGIAVARRRRR
jgi:hypothetical protein